MKLWMFFFSLLGLPVFAEVAQLPDGAEMRYLENGEVKVGVDLRRGGAVVFLSRRGGGNLINNHDRGRQVQLSFYSGPVPFLSGGQQPAKHWAHLGWNPIQAGDDFGHGSPVIEHRVDARTLYVKCQPLQWPLNQVPGECTFESWLELDGPVVKARARLNNARTDATQYPARMQELPALYANAPYQRVVSYTGDGPFQNGPVSEIPRAKGPHPWALWQGTENWAALLDAGENGVGLITPGRIFFTGGAAGPSGPNDTRASGTGYLGGHGQEILDHNIAYEYRYELLPGTLDEIRARAAAVRPTGLPAWKFSSDRQGWHYVNASDSGWPIRGTLEVQPGGNDPQLHSPHIFWRAEDAPFLIVEAACQSSAARATIYWQRHGQAQPGRDDFVNFDVKTDGEFHRYVIRLADVPSYRGAMLRLRLDPPPGGRKGDWWKLKSIRLASQPE